MGEGKREFSGLIAPGYQKFFHLTVMCRALGGDEHHAVVFQDEGEPVRSLNAQTLAAVFFEQTPKSLQELNHLRFGKGRGLIDPFSAVVVGLEVIGEHPFPRRQGLQDRDHQIHPAPERPERQRTGVFPIQFGEVDGRVGLAIKDAERRSGQAYFHRG